jgi:Zn-finger nucleic acid-binding protein
MDCPSCGSELMGVNYGGVGIDHCPNCKGNLVAETQLRAIKRRREMRVTGLGVPRMRPHPEKVLRCPRCDLEMQKSPDYGEEELGPRDDGVKHIRPSTFVVVDQCPSCKTLWLDLGELEAVQVAYRNREAEKKRASSGVLPSVSPPAATGTPATPAIRPDLQEIIARPSPKRLLGRWVACALLIGVPAAAILALVPRWNAWQFWFIYGVGWALSVLSSLAAHYRAKPKQVRWFSGQPQVAPETEGATLLDRIMGVPNYVASTLRWTFTSPKR